MTSDPMTDTTDLDEYLAVVRPWAENFDKAEPGSKEQSVLSLPLARNASTLLDIIEAQAKVVSAAREKLNGRFMRVSDVLAALAAHDERVKEVLSDG